MLHKPVFDLHFPSVSFFFSIPPLKASEKSSTKFKLIPSEAGPKHLLVNFFCDKFADIKTFKVVNVIN